MANFSELNDVNFIMKALSNSDLLTKMLVNMEGDPENIPLQTDASTTNFDLIAYKSLFPYMKILELSEEGVKAYVNVYYGMSKNTSGDRYFKRNFLFVDVYVHQDSWRIDTGIRTYYIMQEIDKIINEKPIAGVNETFAFDKYEAIPNVNTKYAGFGLIYHRNDIGVSGCGEY